jgi:hypothetical protein
MQTKSNSKKHLLPKTEKNRQEILFANPFSLLCICLCKATVLFLLHFAGLFNIS